MALTTVPAPVLDARDEAQVVAEAVGGLPPELSDRSDSNPAVAIIEAAGTVYGKLQYQLNRWPQGVIQKALSLVGVTLEAAQGATVSQTFTLSAPQSSDTVIPEGTQVSTSDGSIVFETIADATIAAYTGPAGTVSTTVGLATVTGAGTAFVVGSTWVGWQIQIPAVTGTWYTIASVAAVNTLTLTTTALATVAGAAWYVGPVTGTASAQATTTGAETNVGAGTLTTLQSSVNAVASTTNGAAATGGRDIETTAAAIERAPEAFGTRDVACTAEDYSVFAARTLGAGGRAMARENINVLAATNGYVTVACLSPAWTATTPASATERGAVVRDLIQRKFTGSTLIDIAAAIYTVIPGCVVWKYASYDAATVRANIGAALNGYLSPNTYAWGRIIYVADLVDVIEDCEGVDRVHVVDGVHCAGTLYTACPAALTLVNGNATALTANTTGYVARRTMVIDAAFNAIYLVVSINAGVSVTFDRVYAGPNNVQTPNRFVAESDDMNGGIASPTWYELPYSNIGATAAAPPASVYILGSV